MTGDTSGSRGTKLGRKQKVAAVPSPDKAFASAVFDLIEELEAEKKLREESQKKLGEGEKRPREKSVTRFLSTQADKAAAHIYQIKTGLRRNPELNSIVSLVQAMGAVGSWPSARTRQETVRLLLLAGYSSAPGLLRDELDWTYPKLLELMGWRGFAKVPGADSKAFAETVKRGNAFRSALGDYVREVEARIGRDSLSRIKSEVENIINCRESKSLDRPLLSSIVGVLEDIRELAGWSQARTRQETLRLLLLAGYSSTPGLLRDELDWTYPKLLELLQMHEDKSWKLLAQPVSDEKKINVGFVPYSSFVVFESQRAEGRQNNFPPPTGFAVDIARLIFDSLLGKSDSYLKWILLSYRQMIEKLDSYDVDLVVSAVIKTPRRSARAAFVDLPLIRLGLGALVKHGLPADQWGSQGTRVAFRSGEIGDEYASTFLRDAIFVPSPAEEDTALALGKVPAKADVALADEISCQEFRKKNGERLDVDHIREGFPTYRIGFIARRSDTQWVSVLRESLALLCEALDPVAAIFQKYGDISPLYGRNLIRGPEKPADFEEYLQKKHNYSDEEIRFYRRLAPLLESDTSGQRRGRSKK